MKFNRAIWTVVSICMMLIAFQITGCGSKGGGGEDAAVEVGDITLTLDVDRLAGDGQSQAVITATVTDIDGNPMQNNTQVTFTSQTMDIDDTQDGVQLTYRTTITGGVATATLTAAEVISDFDPTETVTVTVNDAIETIDITIVGPPVDSGISITSGSASIVADGESKVLITAVVRDENGNPVADGVEVEFSTQYGTFEDYVRVLENPKTVETVNGVSSAYLVSSTNVGQTEVTITVDNRFEKSISIDFVAGAVDHVQVTANPTSIPFGTIQSVITVRAYDENDNPAGSETLKFVAGDGTFEPSNIATTDSDGQAQVTYVAPVAATNTTDSIEVYSTGEELLGTYEITIEGPKVATITLSVDPATLPADGASEADVKAQLTLIGGGTVPDGIEVEFAIKAPGGGSITPTAVTQGGTGIATATLTAGDTPEVITIQASAGGINQEIQIEFTPGNVSVTIVPNILLATGQDTANVTAALTNVFGEPAGENIQVAFTLSDQSLGTITATGLTDGNGEVVVPFTGAQKGGTVTVIATWDSGGTPVSGSGTITVLPPPVQISLAEGFPDPAVINIRGTGGVSTSQITFDISDIEGTTVADGYPFVLSISSGLGGGEEITPTFATTKDGQVSVILRSGTKSGPIGIKITYLFDSKINYDLNNIIIANGPPVGEAFGIAAQYLNVSGLEDAGLEDAITVNVGDIYGNPVPDGTAVSFKTYNTGGIFSNSADVGTVDGSAVNILRTPGSNTAPLDGFAFVTAEANNSGRSTHVTSIDSYFDAQSELVYAGTDGGGVYKSEDGGRTWTNVSWSTGDNVGQNIIDPYVNDISIDPDDPNTIFAATGYLGRGNIYRSVNGGYTWNSNENPEEWYGVFSDNNAVLSILCDDGSDYVWAGTAGRGVVFVENGDDDVINFHWGGWVDPIGPTDWQDPDETILTNPANTGDGTVSDLTLSAASVTENWTLSYERIGITSTTPVLTDVSGSQAGGTMTVDAVDENAGTETWTATYLGGYGAKVIPNGDTVGEEAGILYVDAVTGGRNETWTVTCYDGGVGVDPKFTVTGSISLGNSNYDDISQPYTTDSGEVTFRIVETGLFTIGDTFVFRTTYDGKSRIENTNGELFVTSLSPSTKTEDWTVTCVNAAENQFEVISKWGSQTENHGLYKADPGVSFTSSGGEVTFFISETDVFVNGDVFTFHTVADGWQVNGSASGDQANIARTDVAYTSDNGDVSFTISWDTNFYGTGDFWQFETIATANWEVRGSESGVQENRAETGIPYVTDGYELYFLIEEGSTPFAPGDEFTFTLNDSGLGENRTVRDIVKKPGASGVNAELYAATGKGVYRSTNGGLQWIPTEGFGGDNIMAIACHPTQNVIYVGTESAGVWYSSDNGVTWIPKNDGFGKGLNATSPEPDVYNTGTGIMTIVEVGRDALSETWTVTCEEEVENGGRFSVKGSISGDVTGVDLYDITTGDYVIADVLTFNIADGYLDFAEGDFFTFSTTRDREQHIKDLVVASDGVANDNDRLYAVTYFEGALEPHAVSNVYSIGIDETTGELKDEDWIEANTGLPQFEPPDDTTLFAQHSLAYDNGTLFIGGEGINFYQAGTGVDTGTPVWIESKEGMFNRIMTRMPVLFSGECDMDIFDEINGQFITFKVYIQDENGNPPIAGSDLTVVQKIGDDEEVIFHYTYADGYTAPGTWRDITNPATNNPFIIGPMLNMGDFIFTYTPTCDTTTAPGCSGSIQELTY